MEQQIISDNISNDYKEDIGIELSCINTHNTHKTHKTHNINDKENEIDNKENDINKKSNVIYTIEPKITCIYGKNKYRDYLVCNMIYEYSHKRKYKFGVVIGNVYPYYKYITDNMYMRYDEKVLETYLHNMNELYIKTRGNIDHNILLIDTKDLDLNSPFWSFFLVHHKRYNTDIIIIQEKAILRNVSKLHKYVNVLHVLNNMEHKSSFINEIYTIFYKDLYHKEHFSEMYNNSIKYPLDTMISELDNNSHYLYQINLNLPHFVFNTYKIYNENNIYRQRCIVSDIINV